MAKMEDLKQKLETLIAKSEVIRDTTHIGFHIKPKGFAFWKNDVLKVMGRVNHQEEFDALNSILEKECKGVEIINQLRVENRA